MERAIVGQFPYQGQAEARVAVERKQQRAVRGLPCREGKGAFDSIGFEWFPYYLLPARSLERKVHPEQGDHLPLRRVRGQRASRERF